MEEFLKVCCEIIYIYMFFLCSKLPNVVKETINSQLVYTFTFAKYVMHADIYVCM